MPIASELASRPDFVRIRGLRYHVRRWGDPQRPMLFLGHGWLDVSATFHELVQPLLDRCQVLAPDWRGFGHTQWPQDGYWFQDYVADLDALVQHYSPRQPVWLVGHSMGAQIMSLYAGLRPQQVSRLVCLDGLFLPDMPTEQAPRRFSRWLDQQQGKARAKTYPSFEFLAERIRIQHPRLSPERAHFIARCWSAQDGKGRIRLLADPRHRLDMPTLYKSAESMAIWRQITAPTLFLDAAASAFAEAISADERSVRRNCFAQREEAVIADAGHMLHFDAPATTGRAIRTFLAKDAP